MKQKDGFSGERSIVLPRMIIDIEREDPLVSSLYVTDIGYYPHADGHFRERKEPIGQNVLIYCADGAGWYRVGKHEFTVAANQFFILPAGLPHSYGADAENPWTIYWVHFTGSHSAVYVQGAGCPQDVRPGVHSRINYHLRGDFQHAQRRIYPRQSALRVVDASLLPRLDALSEHFPQRRQPP